MAVRASSTAYGLYGGWNRGLTEAEIKVTSAIACFLPGFVPVSYGFLGRS